MARARPKPHRHVTEIADLIIAEWYRVLPDQEGGAQVAIDLHSLTAGLNEILDMECEAILDEANKIKIVIPLPPARTKSQLDEYLQHNSDFETGMGAAVLFGCGR